MKKILSFIMLLTLPAYANDCKVNADLVVSFNEAVSEHCNSKGKCTTKKVNLPFKVYLQQNNIEQPIPSASYLVKKELAIETCYKDDFTITNQSSDNVISLEAVLGELSDERDKREPKMRYSSEYIDENTWLFQSIPDIRPPVLDNQGNLFILRQKQNDYKEQGSMYSFNISNSTVKFNNVKDVVLSYGVDNSFYVKNDPLFEKYKNDDEGEHILVLGKYGDDQVLVKIDDEHKENKKYQVCLYSFDYYPKKGGYYFNDKNCITYQDYSINQALHDKTYLNEIVE